MQISVVEDGTIYIDEDEIAPGAMTANIEALAQRLGNDPPQILLRADRSLDYGAVMRVMGELNRVGLNRVSLVTTGSAGEP